MFLGSREFTPNPRSEERRRHAPMMGLVVMRASRPGCVSLFLIGACFCAPEGRWMFKYAYVLGRMFARHPQRGDPSLSGSPNFFLYHRAMPFCGEGEFIMGGCFVLVDGGRKLAGTRDCGDLACATYSVAECKAGEDSKGFFLFLFSFVSISCLSYESVKEWLSLEGFVGLGQARSP